MSWESKNIENCIDRVTYTDKIKRKEFQRSGDFPIISQEQDFINGYWSNEKQVFKVTTPVVIFGDHTKVIKYVDFNFVLGADGVKILQPKSFIYPKYFYYYLQAFPVKSLGYARHYRILKQLDIQYPQSITEQKRIVEILDEAFAGIDKAIANTEKNLPSARELFDSYLESLFQKQSKGFKLFKGVDAFSTITPKKKIKKKDYLNKGIVPIVAQEAGLINGYCNNVEDITPTDGPIIIFGDHTKVLKYIDFDFVAGADGTKILKPNNIDPLCLFYALKSVNLDEKGYARHFKLIKEADFYLPEDKAKQLNISKKIKEYEEKILCLEKMYNQKLDSLNELKQSLLQKAFSGELTANDVSEEVAA